MELVKKHWQPLLLVIVFGFLFFFRFDWLPLVNYDEAWYGSIAKNIANTGNFMKMDWNGKIYYDHPPMGFIILALSIKLFGVNEFAVRLPAVVLGIGSILLIYFIGKKIFRDGLAGMAAAMTLGTSVWYLIRVRSGDLDSTFIFFYLLTVFFSFKAREKFSWFLPTMISFAFLMLTKTIIGTSAAVLILFNTALSAFKNRKNFLIALFSVMAFFVLVVPWYYVQLTSFQHFYEEHFFRVGMRSKTLSSYFHIETFLPMFYLHMGIRKWYYIWLASLGLIVLTLRFLRKNILFLIFWNFIILYPFLTTNDTQIWHLIPVYMPISLIVTGGLYGAMETAYLFIKKFRFNKIKIKILKFRFEPLKNNNLFRLFFISFFIFISAWQIKNLYKEVYPTSHFVPEDVKVAREMAKYDKPVYLDDDFVPVAVYYSGKKVTPLLSLPDNQKKAIDFYNSYEGKFILVTRNYVLNLFDENNVAYKRLYKNDTYSIIEKP